MSFSYLFPFSRPFSFFSVLFSLFSIFPSPLIPFSLFLFFVFPRNLCGRRVPVYLTRGSGGAGPDGNLMARHLLGASGKTNVCLTCFLNIAFPWSVALKSLAVSSALNVKWFGAFWDPFLAIMFLPECSHAARCSFFWRRSVPMQCGARFLV